MRQVAKRKQVEKARTELMRRLVHAQEEEHRRIARELHDDLTQRLAVLAIDAGMLEQLPGCPADVEERAAACEAVDGPVRERPLPVPPASPFHPGRIGHRRCLTRGVSQPRPTRRNCGPLPRSRRPEPNFPEKSALCVYRVTQEALRNVARHAKTRQASVRLFATDRQLVLRVGTGALGSTSPDGASGGSAWRA